MEYDGKLSIELFKNLISFRDVGLRSTLTFISILINSWKWNLGLRLRLYSAIW